MIRNTLLLLCLTAALHAQSNAQSNAQANAQSNPDPKASCRAIRHSVISPSTIGLPTAGAQVDSTRLTHSGPAEYCKVLGQILPIDPNTQSIHFELNLPTQWNGKAVHYGGGGFDGALSVADGLHTPEAGIRTDPTPLQHGYATFGSDSGHHTDFFHLLPNVANELESHFARNLEERRNFAHDALGKVHDTAAELIRRFYGVSARRMYFLGGSTGGREAYFITQLFPQDYDGVLGAYAGWDQVELDLQFIRTSQALYKQGDRQTRGWLPKSATRLVAARVLESCDAADGLRDGILSNPAACHFDPAPLLCGPGASGRSCLTPGQLQTFQTFATPQQTDQPLAHGVTSIPGYDIFSGTDLTGSTGLFRHPMRTPLYPFNSFGYVVGTGVLRNFLTGKKHFKALTFNTATGGAYAEELLPQSLASDASDADLTPFMRHGGKFLIIHGTTDATIPTGASTQFYTMLQAKMGQPALDSFVRFYLIPGYAHGHGVFNAGFDALTVLDRWVEQGTAPENLVATDNNQHTNPRTRPLCPYPTWPRYTAGNPDQATSFTCTAPTN